MDWGVNDSTGGAPHSTAVEGLVLSFHPDQPRHCYSTSLGGLLILLSLSLFITWGIRAYILAFTAPDAPFALLHWAMTVISLAGSTLLLQIGYRAARRQRRATDGRWLAIIGAWISVIGLNRLTLVLTQPAHDPNPRAHLHLSVLFLVTGAILLGIAWLWRRGPTP